MNRDDKMSLDDMFRFISHKERKRAALEYQRKIFPLGTEQKDAALSALRPLISPRIRDEDVLYAFITAKQEFIEDGNSENMARSKLNSLHLCTSAEKEYIMALISLDVNANSLDEYPSSDDVARTATKNG